MGNYSMILTKVGLAKVTNAQLTNENVLITHFVVGDGDGANYVPTQEMVALKNEKWRGAVSSVEIDKDNPHWIVVTGAIPAKDGGFMIREAGLIDKDGDLVAVGNTPETYKPLQTEGAAKDLILKQYIEVSNAANVTLQIDPTVIIASRDYVDRKVESQKDETSKRIKKLQHNTFNAPTINHAHQVPCFTIIDDDVAGAVWSTLRLLAAEFDIPITCATVTKFVIDGHSGGKGFAGSALTLEQMKTLQRDYGFEFVPHTHSHPRLTDLTEEEIDEELRTCQEWLIEHNFSGYETIVYPYGAENATVRKVARRYFKSGFDTDDGLGAAVGVPIANQYAIRRVFDTYGVQKAKDAIDDAVTNNKWLVYGTHCWYDDFSMADMREIIAYALAAGIKFVTVEEGLARFGNVIDITDGTSSFKVGADGKVNLGLIIETANAHTINSPLTDFTANAVTYTPITYAEAQNAGYPIKQGGIMKTYRVGSSAGSYYREYEAITNNATTGVNTTDVFRQYWLNGAWTDFSNTEKTLELNNDWNGTLKYKKSNDNVVSLSGTLTAGVVTQGTIITQLPIGFRPKHITPLLAYNSTKIESQIGLFVSDTGNLSVRLPLSSILTTGDVLHINALFAL